MWKASSRRSSAASMVHVSQAYRRTGKTSISYTRIFVREREVSILPNLLQRRHDRRRKSDATHYISLTAAVGGLTLSTTNRDHSFPQNTEFRAEPRNLPVSAEFLCFLWEFCGIWYWLVIQGTNTAYSDGVPATILYVYMISP